MSSISSVIRDLQGRLMAAHPVAPGEAKQLVKHVLGMDDIALVLQGDSAFPADTKDMLEGLAARRMAGEPLAHVLGYAWFYGRTWKVTPDTLIPRPDTETLVEAALTRISDSESRICEVGIGTGCVMGTLLAENGRCRTLGIDLSEKALVVAAHNVRQVGGDGAAEGGGGRWELLRNDGLEGVAERFQMIVSNPPYIADAEWEELEGEVRDFEPRLALTGGVPNDDGLVFYRRLAQWGITHLEAKGWLCVEVGWQQAEAVRQLLQDQNDEVGATNNTRTGALWQNITITKDLGGRDRVVCAQRC